MPMRQLFIFLCLITMHLAQGQTLFNTYGSACSNCVFPNPSVPSGCYRLTNIQTPSGLSACPSNPNNSANNFCTYGQIWSSTCLNLARPFTLNTTMYFGTEGTGYWGPGADGMCFVLKNNSTPITTAQNGGMLGYTSNITPTPNSMAVEFDTYLNGGNSIQNDPTDPSSPSGDHVSVFRSGSLAHGSINELTPAVFVGQLEDGLPHNVIFSWSPNSQNFSVSIDGNTIINLTIDLQTVINSNTAYFGWTAASGWTGNVHWVCPNYTGVTTLPSETFSNCESGNVVLNANEVGPGPINWTPSNGLSASSGTTVTAFQPGNYTARYVDGCGLVTEKLFIVNNIPPSVMASDTVVCVGDTWTLSPTSGNYTQLGWVNNNSPLDTIWANSITGIGDAQYQVIPYHSSCPNAGTAITVEAHEFIITPLFAGNDTAQCLPFSSNPFTLPNSVFQFPNDATVTWSTSNGSIENYSQGSDLTVNNSGDYVLTATYSNGCSLSDSITITLTNNPEFGIIGNNYLCQGATDQLSIIGNFENIVWTNTAGDILGNNNAITISNADSYIVEAMSYGCWGNDTITVQSVFATNPNAGENIQVCSNDPLTITGTANSNYQILWTTSNGSIVGNTNSSTIDVATSGLYIIHVVDEFGCTALDDIEVIINPIPTFSLGDDFSLCPQTPYTASIPSGVVYDQVTWQNNSHNPNFSSSSGNSGIINLTATLDLGQCSFTDILTITVYTLPNWSLPDDFSICLGENIEVSSTQLVDWANGPTSNVFDLPNPAPGSYPIEATLPFGQGCSLVDEIIVTVYPLPVISLNVDGDITCAHPTATLTASTIVSNPQIQWSANSQGNLPSPNPLSLSTTIADSYFILCTDPNTQCSNTANILVNSNTEIPIVNFTSPDTLSCWSTAVPLDHYTVTNTNNYTASWTSTDGAFSPGTENSIFPLAIAAGTYALNIINNDNGCEQTFLTQIPQTIDLGFDANDMEFPNVITRNKDAKNDFWRPFLKQNPEWDFYVYFKVYNMKVFNRWGALVFESTPSQPYWNASEVNTGDYFFTFEYTTQCGTIQSGKVNGSITIVE